MSAAYQCDACGKLYKPNSEEGWLSTCGISFYGRHKNSPNNGSMPLEDLDLCPECLEKVINVLNLDSSEKLRIKKGVITSK